jgi:hypothetical protein
MLMTFVFTFFGLILLLNFNHLEAIIPTASVKKYTISITDKREQPKKNPNSPPVSEMTENLKIKINLSN